MHFVVSYSRPTASAGTASGVDATTGLAAITAAPVNAAFRALRRLIAMASIPSRSGARGPATDVRGPLRLVETPRRDVAGAEHRTADRAGDRRRDGTDGSLRRVDRRIGVGRRRPIDRHRRVHRDPEGDRLLGAADTRMADADRPAVDHLAEGKCRAVGVRHRPLASELVEAVALPVSLVAE